MGSKPWKQKLKKNRGVQGFRNPIAIDGSLNRVSRRDAACGWAVVQLDHDKEEEPWYDMCGTMLDELEVQRTIKRTVLWAFTRALSGLLGPSTIHTDSVDNLDGLWRGGERCIGLT